MTGKKHNDKGVKRWLRPRNLIKVAVMVLLPPLVMAGLATVIDPDTVKQIMIYGAPLAVLPLALKWLRRRSVQARDTKHPQTVGEKQ